tara:strand:- start:876 stop:1136 length:261 start_codon:yes stop_codon:yes gene_type:complete
MNWVNYIGIFAGILTTISFIPQVIKVWKSKSTKDLSAWWLLIFCVGVSSWLLYGFLIIDLPIIIANAATIFLLLFIVIAKIIFRNN